MRITTQQVDLIVFFVPIYCGFVTKFDKILQICYNDCMLLKIMRKTAAVALTVLMCVTTVYSVRAENILENVTAGAGKIDGTTSDRSAGKSNETSAMVAVSGMTESAAPAVATAGAGDNMVSSGDSAMTVVNFDSSSDVSASDQSEEAAAEEKDELSNLCVAEVENAMNVRSEPSEEASVAGYLYKNCVGEIIERKDGWTRVKSGDLEGWANDDYLLFDQEARAKIEETNSKVATVNTETLRVRSEPDENSTTAALLGEGAEVNVVSAGEDWTKINFDDGTEGKEEGYVSNEFISLGYAFLEGETIAEVEAREKKAKEEKEAAAKAKKASEKTSSAPAANQTTQTTTTNNGPTPASVDDETLLAALIQCECGNDSYEGKLAVGSVVVNRARGAYGSISKAIYAPGQFGPASSGKLALTLSTGAISGSSRQAAQDAIAGLSNIGAATHFRNSKSGYSGVVVGHHVFW